MVNDDSCPCPSMSHKTFQKGDQSGLQAGQVSTPHTYSHKGKEHKIDSKYFMGRTTFISGYGCLYVSM